MFLLFKYDRTSTMKKTSTFHEFWINEDGQPMLDNRPLRGVQEFKMWGNAHESVDFIHVTISLICHPGGPHRNRKGLEIAYREAMEALEDD